MKKLLVGLLVLFLFSISSVFSQTDSGKWIVRARGFYTMPNENSNYKGDNDSGNIDISDAFAPELDVSYFFSDNIAIEFAISTSKHDVGVEYSDFINHYSDLGYYSMLPLTMNLQYHFDLGKFKPYAGAGVNYTVFYGEGKEMNTGLPHNLELSNTFGFSLQGGLDFMITDNWLINLDVKNLFISTDGIVKTGACIEYAAKAIPCPDYEIIETEIDVDINPFMIGLGIGYRF